MTSSNGQDLITQLRKAKTAERNATEKARRLLIECLKRGDMKQSDIAEAADLTREQVRRIARAAGIEPRAERAASENSAECPYCHQTFYAPALHDPIRKHVDYCESAPENKNGM